MKKHLLLLISILYITQTSASSMVPTIVKRLETIQCWEDLKDVKSDLDFQEPCEKVIEYILVDANDNLYEPQELFNQVISSPQSFISPSLFLNKINSLPLNTL